jgi:hypothetical protein
MDVSEAGIVLPFCESFGDSRIFFATWECTRTFERNSSGHSECWSLARIRGGWFGLTVRMNRSLRSEFLCVPRVPSVLLRAVWGAGKLFVKCYSYPVFI